MRGPLRCLFYSNRQCEGLKWWNKRRRDVPTLLHFIGRQGNRRPGHGMMNLQKCFPNRGYDLVYLVIFVVMFAFSLVDLMHDIRVGSGSAIVDNLFNFGGGFVRRGLSGEISFFLKDHLGVPLAWSVYLTYVSAYFFLAAVTVYYFVKRGYGLNVLIMAFALGGVLVYGFDQWRRDFMELSLLAIVLMTYGRMPGRWWLVAGNVLIMFGILLHEATFFFTVPILILVYNARCGNILRSVCAWLPSIAMFGVCCVFKGTPEALPLVVERAQAYAPQCFPDGKVPWLLQFMGRDPADVFDLHLMYNFKDVNCLGPIPFPAFLFTLFYVLYAPYMTVAMLIGFTPRRIPGAAVASLVRIMGVQFVCLLPMFTVLSCDIARVLCYWIMSSLLVWLIVGGEAQAAMFRGGYRRFGDAVARKVFARVPGRLPLTLAVLFVGIIFYIRAPFDAVVCSLAYQFAHYVKSLCLWLCV